VRSFTSVFIAVIIAAALIAAAFIINSRRPRAEVEQPAAANIRASGKCAECHARETSAIVHEYEMSRHAEKGVNCLDCHGPVEGQTGYDHRGFKLAKTLTSGNCARCHAAQYRQFLRSRHAAPSWAAVTGPRDFKPDIVEAIEENENLCNWVHLPVQSGSDRILKSMRRLNTIDSYKKKIDRIRSSERDISLTTDIIVGFPGETDEDFRETVRLVEYCGYDSAYIFKYSPRPGTPSFVMKDDVSETEKTARFLELERVQRKVQNRRLQRYLGKSLQVLAERDSTKSTDDISGHSTCHKVVNFRGGRDMIGTIKDVRITEIKSNSLYGEVC